MAALLELEPMWLERNRTREVGFELCWYRKRAVVQRKFKGPPLRSVSLKPNFLDALLEGFKEIPNEADPWHGQDKTTRRTTEFWNSYIMGIHGIRIYHVSWVIHPSTLKRR